MVVALHKRKAQPWVVALAAAAGGCLAGVALLRLGAAETLALVLLPAVVYALLRSLWVSYAGVIAVLALAPFATLPLGGPVTPTLLELALLASLCLQLAVLLVDRRAVLKVGGPQALWLLLVGVTAFAFALGLGRGYTTETLHTYVAFVLAMGTFWLTLQLCDSPRDVGRVLVLLAGTTTAAAALAMALYLGGAGLTERVLLRLVPYGYPGSRIVRYIEDDPARPMRAIGTSVDPNSFGGLLMVGFVLVIGLLVATHPLVPRWCLMGAIVLIGTAMLLTYSRGAWVGACVGAGIVIALRRPRWLVPFGLFGVVGLIFGLGSGFVERLWLGITLQDPATKLRLAEYRNAWEIIQRHPWFGVGFGDAPSVDLQAGVSSAYLTIMERAGVVGLLAFAAVVGLIFLRSVRPALRRDAVGDLYLTVGAAFVAALTAGLVDHYFFNPRFAHMVALFWILAGLLVALQSMQSGSFLPPAHRVRSAEKVRPGIRRVGVGGVTHGSRTT